MSKIGTSTHLKGILGKISYTKEVINLILSLRKFDSSEIARQRMKIIKFYETYGEEVTKEAFGVNRKTIYVWRKRLKEKKGKLVGLIPFSTKPKNTRRMTTNPKVIEFIKSTREKYPRLGKEKIYPLLCAFCAKEGIKPIKESTIGKVIKRNNLFFQRQERIYHNPNFKYMANRHKTKRLRLRYAPKPKDLGHIQMDTILRFEDGKKFYFYSFIDTKGKYAFCLPYKKLDSGNTLDFYRKIVEILPYKIKSIQTDNGLEFLGHFDQYLKRQNIPHFFTYPRCPRINGVVERFNRSLQEEFITPNIYLIHNQKLFSSLLADYLIFYNYQRVHKALGLKSPAAYLFEKGIMSKKSVTYTKT